MRVMVFAESFLPHMNGVTNSVLHALAHFERHGHDALVVAPGADGGRDTVVHGARVVRVPSIPAPGYPQVRVSAGGKRRLDHLIDEFRPDVVHLASPFVLGWQGVRAAERAGVPSVAVYQTDLPGYAAKYGVPGTQRAVERHIARLHSRASLTLAPSSAALRDLARIGVPRVTLWGRGVDAARFRPGRRDPRIRAELAPRGDAIVGYVGRLAPEKQVEDLAVLDGIPGIRLVIVGDGPSRAELERTLPHATFLGFRSGDELASLMASFDVFVHPGEHETFCQTVQEALASGVPVVATGRGGPVDLVDSSRTGWLYEPGNLEELRARVLDLVGDDHKRDAFGAAALESVAGRTWEAVCEQLVRHYESAIRARARSGAPRRGVPAEDGGPLVNAHAAEIVPALPEAAPAWTRYVALGDSLTEGLCDTSRQPEGHYRGWADRLASLVAHGRDDARIDFANLAVRSKRIDEIIAHQLPLALRMRPDLVSVLAGANDIVRPTASPHALADRLGSAVGALADTGATVVVVGVFAPPYPGLGLLHARIRRFNARLREHADRHGALFVDFASDPAVTELASWADDRVHLSSRGHRALCYRAAARLGIPGASELGALDQVMHDDGPPAIEPWSSVPQWMWSHLRPWAARRVVGRRAGDGRQPKHVEPVEIHWRTAELGTAPPPHVSPDPEPAPTPVRETQPWKERA